MAHDEYCTFTLNDWNTREGDHVFNSTEYVHPEVDITSMFYIGTCDFVQTDVLMIYVNDIISPIPMLKHYCIVYIEDVSIPGFFNENYTNSSSTQGGNDSSMDIAHTDIDKYGYIYDGECTFMNENETIVLRIGNIHDFVNLMDMYPADVLKWPRNLAKMIVTNRTDVRTMLKYLYMWYAHEDYEPGNQKRSTIDSIVNTVIDWYAQAVKHNITVIAKYGDDVNFSSYQMTRYVQTHRRSLEVRIEELWNVDSVEDVGTYALLEAYDPDPSIQILPLVWKNIPTLWQRVSMAIDTAKLSYTENVASIGTFRLFDVVRNTYAKTLESDRTYGTMLQEIRKRPQDAMSALHILMKKRDIREYTMRQDVHTINMQFRSTHQSILLQQYVNGDMHYNNLPDYNSTDQVIWHPSDYFQIEAWRVSDAHFEGFLPHQKRRPRLWIPADWIAMLYWIRDWGLRASIVRTALPFLEEFLPEARPDLCLPEWPFIPDPRFGCAPLLLAPFPALYRKENIRDIYNLNMCGQWRLPHQKFAGLVQLLLTPTLGPIIEEDEQFAKFLDVFHLRWIVNNATGLQGSDALPPAQHFCVLAAAPLTIFIFVIIGIAVYVGIVACVLEILTGCHMFMK